LPVEKKALEIIRETGFIDPERLSRRLGVPPAAAEKIVESLKRKGILTESGCSCEKCPLSKLCPYAGGKGPKMFIVLKGERR